MTSMHSKLEVQMQTTNRDYSSKAWLEELNRQEDQRGFLGVVRNIVGALLAVFAIGLLVCVALGLA